MDINVRMEQSWAQTTFFRDVLLSNQIYRKQIIRAATIEFVVGWSSSKIVTTFTMIPWILTLFWLVGYNFDTCLPFSLYLQYDFCPES